MKKKISQSQLILPLLDAIEERGGTAKARDVYDLVAEKVELSAEDRAARITISANPTMPLSARSAGHSNAPSFRVS
jgi:site-specific DNA-methyltransferase (cytosine-N4-specific)